MNLSKNNSKRDFQVMKDLTQRRQSSVSSVHDKEGKISLKNKSLLVNGQNTVKNSVTSRSMETLRSFLSGITK